jgi:hypothetical protein
MNLTAYAADLAPLIDRLFIAGHRAAGKHAQALGERLQVSSFGILIDLRTLLLGPRGMSFEEARSIQRYLNASGTEAGLLEEERAGRLVRSGDRWMPTETGRELLLGLSEALERGTADLWLTVVSAADRYKERFYPALEALLDARTTIPRSAPFACWQCVAELRYLRADVYAEAWRNAGLDSSGILALTSLCHAQGPIDVEQIGGGMPYPEKVAGSLEHLRARGWLHELKRRVGADGTRTECSIVD